jgi:hypothetical protein
MTPNGCNPLSPRRKVIRVSAERAPGKRRVSQLTLGQTFNQKASEKTVRFLGVDECVDGIVNPHFAERHSLDWHGVPRKRQHGNGILA